MKKKKKKKKKKGCTEIFKDTEVPNYCRMCKTALDVKSLNKDGYMFIYMSVRDQLKSILAIPSYLEEIRKYTSLFKG